MDLRDLFMPAFGLPGGSEWLILLVIALLLFGRRLPEIMRGLGGSIKEFKSGMDEGPKPEAKPAIPPPVDGSVSRTAAMPLPPSPAPGDHPLPKA